MSDTVEFHQTGYLELFLGPMWAGKTSALISIYNFAITHDITCVAINHTIDCSSTNQSITSHDGVTIPGVSSNVLRDIFNTSDPNTEFNFDIILINEGQFFPDLYDWTSYMVNHLHKNIYIAALDGDYKKIGFPNIIQILPEADSFTKLHNICKQCNHNIAIFTHRTSSYTSQILPGTEHYIPLCRKCYNKSI